MPQVSVHWRPSGGRGEYEHVPSNILLNRRVIVKPVSVAGAEISTDVSGHIRDGKPRLRRQNPNNRSVLNLPPLIAALALLPDPKREDEGGLILPLKDKRYVIRTILFDVQYGSGGIAYCTPIRMRVLHDANEIDLAARLHNVGTILRSAGLSGEGRALADRYLALVSSGSSSAELRSVATGLLNWIDHQPEIAGILESPSDEFVETTPSNEPPDNFTLEDISVDETKRRLVSHYRIDRNRKIRKAKVAAFAHQHGAIYCENCEFSFEQKYGNRGRGFIEVHHIQPLAALLPNVVTKLTDLMLLCSNCHRMVHRKKPLLLPEQLSEITVAGWP